MLSFTQKQNLFNAGIFYKPIVEPRSVPLGISYWYIGEDLAGARLTAAVADHPNGEGRRMTLGAAVLSSELRTFGDLVSDGFITTPPHGRAAADEVYLNSIGIESAQSTFVQIPEASDVCEDLVHYWDCVIEDDPRRVLCAGEFILIGGVS